MLVASVEKSTRKNGVPSQCERLQKMEKLANTMSMTRKVNQGERKENIIWDKSKPYQRNRLADSNSNVILC